LCFYLDHAIVELAHTQQAAQLVTRRATAVLGVFKVLFTRQEEIE
jgi:hypothetical protein